MNNSHGNNLRKAIQDEGIIPLIGVYDVLSSTIAARYFNGLFISGFSFAASFYGLPDVGFIAWSDIVSFVQRTRALLPQQHIMVDIDDGYCDPQVACHVVASLEAIGASGVVMEDQLRPRKCGHLEGKQIMELKPFLEKLQGVLETRKDLFVVARTDAGDEREALKRAVAFAEAGADAVLVEAVKNLDLLRTIYKEIRRPIVFNQIAGGKSPRVSLAELKAVGVSLVNYSTPCLFAAHDAMHGAMRDLRRNGGRLPQLEPNQVDVKACNAFLHDNITLRSITGSASPIRLPKPSLERPGEQHRLALGQKSA